MKKLLSNDSPPENETETETQPLPPQPQMTKEVMDAIDKDIVDPKKVEDKQRIIFTIQKYQDSKLFGDIVKNELGFKQSFSELNDTTMEDLHNILSRIRIHLDNKNIAKFYDSIATSLAITYESVVSPFYNVEGFSDMLLDNEEFWTIFERFKCDNELPSINPSAQLLFIIAQTSLMAHHLPPPDDDYEMQAPPDVDTIIKDLDIMPSIHEENEIVEVKKQEVKEPKKEIKPLKIGSLL